MVVREEDESSCLGIRKWQTCFQFSLLLDIPQQTITDQLTFLNSCKSLLRSLFEGTLQTKLQKLNEQEANSTD